ncbi:MAG TPA: BolA/IbaG family iron-sulfur metabolism protein [Steroidobacteraceae bacterium]|nr:BolA/IbaG family iron-sulfur metabolism protein [Steroidobacteraceae bacterium]
MNATEVQSLIEAGLPGARVRVSSPDDTHFEAVIVAPQFEGKRTIQRHQLVYGTLGALMGREIHALTMQVMSPQEAAAAPAGGNPGRG